MGTKIRIVVVSEDLAEPWDEGIKNFTYAIARAMEKAHEVLLLNVDRSGVDGSAAVRIPGTKTFLSRALARAVSKHRPDIVLYVPSPSHTLASFGRSWALRRYAPNARIGMVALIPRRHAGYTKPFLRLTAPDIIWVPSYRSLLHLSRLSLRGDVLPVGVDLGVFRRPAKEEKEAIRKRMGIARDAFVFLHVGHLSGKRNLGILGELSREVGAEVLLVGSTSTPEDGAIRADLESKGVRVVRERVNVDEYYRAADCYVFPVLDSEGCVELPLSVLEALASGLRVLSTPFGGLRDFFLEGEDLIFWTSPDELKAAAAKVRRGHSAEVRDMTEFGWDRIAGKIVRTLKP